ncbi:MAG: hypothetical protein ACTHN5_08310 [Phycisphaerae bacterium]
MTITAAIQKIATAHFARLRYAFAPTHDYRPATPDSFPNLRLAWYAETQSRFERLHFKFLCDLEPLDFNKRHPDCPTFERCMTNGPILAAFTQLHPRGRAKAKLRQPISRPGLIELSTELSDGATLATHNSRDTAQRLQRPNYYSFRLRGAPPEELLTAHTGRLDWLLHQRPTANPLPILTYSDLIASLYRVTAKRHAWFNSPGFDLDHYINLFGRHYSNAANRAIAATVRKMLAENTELPSDTPFLEDPDD